MNRTQLAALFSANSVPVTSYFIEGAYDEFWHDNCTFLRASPSGGWDVGYYERGMKDVLAHFSEEAEACDWMVRTFESYGRLRQ